MAKTSTKAPAKKAITKPVKPAKKKAADKQAAAGEQQEPATPPTPPELPAGEQQPAAEPQKGKGDNGGNTLTDKELRGIAFYHFDKIKAQTAIVEAAKKDLADLYATAKEDGVAKKDLAFMLKCDDLDKKGKEAARVKREAEIASWFALPIHYQKDMFDLDRVEPLPERAKREGYAAGYAGKDPVPPYGIDSEAGQIWMTEWHSAQADRRAEFQSGMEKKIAARRMQAEPDDQPFDEDENEAGTGGDGTGEGAPAGTTFQ